MKNLLLVKVFVSTDKYRTIKKREKVEKSPIVRNSKSFFLLKKFILESYRFFLSESHKNSPNIRRTKLVFSWKKHGAKGIKVLFTKKCEKKENFRHAHFIDSKLSE